MHPYGDEDDSKFVSEDSVIEQNINANKIKIKLNKKNQYQQIRFHEILTNTLTNDTTDNITTDCTTTKSTKSTILQIAPDQEEAQTASEPKQIVNLNSKKRKETDKTTKVKSQSLVKKVKQEKFDNLYVVHQNEPKIAKFSNTKHSAIFVTDDIEIEKFDYYLKPNQWLSDAHIDLAIEDFRNSYSKIAIYDVIKLMQIHKNQHCYRPEDKTGEEDQIYFVNSSNIHWFVLTNIDLALVRDEFDYAGDEQPPRKRNWLVYDSTNNKSAANLSALKPFF